MALTKFLSNLVINGATGTVLDVQGSVGQLFSVTDSLTGDLFAVSDISGIPILNVNSSGLVTIDGNLNLGDSDKIQLGASQDLQIYHDGTHSYINDNGTGELRFISNGATRFKIGSDVASLTGTDFAIAATRKLYLDGQSNTYITESSSDTIKFFTGGTEVLQLANNAATFAGAITATNFSGSSSGTNTGDQTLPTDFVSAASGGTFSAGITISNTFPFLDFVDTNSFTDVGDRFRVRAGANQGLIQWYDASAGSTQTIMSLDPDGDVDIVGDLTADNFSGSSSGTNTGDQDLSGYSTASGVADNADNYGSWTVSDGTNTESITSGTTVAWRGSGATSVSYDSSTNQFSISSTNTQYSAATTSAAGLMSSTDKTKLNGVATSADVTPSWVPANDPSYLTSSSTQSKYLRSDAADSASELITFSKGISSDGNSKFYNWRALNNSSNSGNSYWKIADISGTDHSSRFIVTLAGRSTSYSDGTLPAMGHVVGQLNNDNNWDLVFYNHSTASSEVVSEVAIVDDGALGVDLWIKTGNYAEITASGHISDGSFTVNANASSDGFTEAPDGYTVVTEYTSYNSGNLTPLTIGTTSTTALAGNTSLLQLGTTSTTAMAGNTLSAQDLTDIGNLSGTNTGDQVLPTLSSLGALSASGTAFSLSGNDVAVGESITLAGGLSYSGTTLTSANDNTTYTAGTGLTLTGTSFSVTANTYAAASHTHAATDITTGTLDIARIPTVDSKVSEFIENKHIYQRAGSIGVYMPMVKGGLYATSSSSKTGQLKIKLPSYKPAIMISFHVDVYEYDTDRQQSYLISGYAYNDTNATWYNTSAICLSDSDNRNLIVRFYSDTEAGEQYVTIGETNSGWVYPQVVVRDVMGGYDASIGELSGTWGISFIEDNPGTSHAAHSDNQPIIDHSRISGTLTVSQGGTGGTTAAAARTNLGAASTSVATTSANGLMSSTDKTKLDGIEASADVTDTANVVAALTAGTNVTIASNGTISSTDTDTVYTHPTSAGNKHIPTGGSAGQFLKYSSSGTAVWAAPSYTTNTDTQLSDSYVRGLFSGGTNVTLASDGTISSVNTTYSTSDFDAAGSAATVQSNLDSVAANVAGISNQSNTDVDTGTETIAQVSKGTYTAAFFDFVIKNGTNVRAGTVYSCHDGTNVEFTETSTVDLGDTSDVTLAVDISGTNMRLRATTTSDNWSVKSLVRAI
jgi:flagellar basal body rod protein FlgF